MNELTPQSSADALELNQKTIIIEGGNDDNDYNYNNEEGENVELNQRRVRFSRENSHRRRQSTTTASYQLNEQSFFRSASRNRTLKMVLLTQCIAGLQFTWAVELSYGTPYLLSIGLSKSLMSLVWVAGPLSGLLMQPIVGALSDNSTSRFGRRRPFMVIGSLIVAIALMFIGWTQEIVYSFVDEESPTSLTLKKSLAVVSFYLLDFAINAIQASCRALIVDSLSTSQQEEGTAWAGRMIGIGGVAGYFMGFIDLPAVFPFLGGTQLQVLCALASIILLSSIGITCWTISEKVLQRSDETKNTLVEAYEVLATIIKSFRNLPRTVRLLCTTQFFAWIGWFPFLFYATVWVSEVYNHSSSSSSSSNSGNVVVVGNGDDNEEDKLGDSTRIGSLTLLIYSIVSMIASIVLPFLVNPSDSSSSTTALSNSSATITSKIFRLPIPWLTLPRLWTISHFIFGGSMLLTLFVTEVYQADFLFSIVGISWAVSMWAPFSILGEVISSQSRLSLNSDNYDDDGDESYEAQEMSYKPVKSVKVEEDEEDEDYHDTNDTNDNNIDNSDNNNNKNSSSKSNGKIIIDNNNDDDIDNNDNDIDNEINSINNDNNNAVFTDAGIILGIHNIFVVVPQFLVTFISSVIFAILESNNNDGGGRSDSIGFMLRFGGIMAIFAGFLSIRLWK